MKTHKEHVLRNQPAICVPHVGTHTVCQSLKEDFWKYWLAKTMVWQTLLTQRRETKH